MLKFRGRIGLETKMLGLSLRLGLAVEGLVLFNITDKNAYNVSGWLGSRVASVLDSGAEGPGFKSQPRRCRVTVLANCSHPLCLRSPSSEIGSSPLKRCGGNYRPGGK